MRNGFLYMKVYNDIRRKIEDGEYQSGEKLPSDKQFSEEYGVSLITVKKALEMLKDQGLVKRVSGTGSFVTDKHSSVVLESFLTYPDSKGNKKIGLVMERVSSSFGLDIMYHLDRILEQQGYHLLTRFSYYDREKEEEEIRFLLEEGVEGIMVMPCHGMFYNPQLLKLILEGFPVVILDKKMDGISVSSVRTDHYGAVESLVYEMHKRGCRSLGAVTIEDSDTPSVRKRLEAFYKTSELLGITIVGECRLSACKNIYNNKPKKNEVDKAEKYLQSRIEHTDGFVAMEYNLVPIMLEAGKRLEHDLVEEKRICCVDGMIDSGILHMQQDEKKIAESAANILLTSIAGEKEVKDLMVPAVLVE